jgi:hypothetical protein
MIQTVEDVNEQSRLWDAVFSKVQRRFDLAAEVRFEQGRLWEKAGKLDLAGRCYEDVIERYANAGPFVIDALRQAEKLLKDSRRERMIPDLYAKAWSGTKKPDSRAAQFYRQSNWYRIGVAYAKRLSDANRGRDADEVHRELARLEAGKSGK